MRGFLRFAVVGLAAVACFAAPIATGTANWQVAQTGGTTLNSGNALNTYTSAVVLTGALPGVWVSAPVGSAWVGQVATDGNQTSGQCLVVGGANTCGAQPGQYTYTLSFVNALGGTLTGFQYTSDDSVSLTIADANGTLYSSTSGSSAFSALISAASSYNWVGSLTITAVVTNAVYAPAPLSLTPSGFLAVGDVTLNSETIPEPSTYAMLGLGGAAMLVARLRRRK